MLVVGYQPSGEPIDVAPYWRYYVEVADNMKVVKRERDTRWVMGNLSLPKVLAVKVVW